MMRRLVLVLLLAAAGCSSGKVAPPKKRPPPLVVVARPELRDVDVTLSYTVDIRPIEQAELQSKIAGYVERIYVDRGDPVKKGQLLAEVRPSELGEQVNMAREQVGQSEASFRLAEETARRARELFGKGLISKADLDRAEAELQIAQASRGSARSGLGAVSTRLSETRITAPFTGWVARRYLDRGALVTPGPQNATLLTLMRIDQVKVNLSIPEGDAPKVTRGQPAVITVDALPGKRFEGKVTRVPPALDLTTRTLEAEVVVPNPDDVLKPGMYGRATLTVDKHPKALVLPVEAVVADERERAVYVVEEVKPGDHGPPVGRARRVVVETGFDGGEWLEITSGLAGDESVIVMGTDLASDGAPVSVAQKDAKEPRQARKTPNVADSARPQ